jgi:hypothetical protein
MAYSDGCWRPPSATTHEIQPKITIYPEQKALQHFVVKIIYKTPLVSFKIMIHSMELVKFF